MSERKEILTLSGRTIAIGMIVLADLVIAFAMYRWHEHSVFVAEQVGQKLYGQVLREEHDLKEKIRVLEGVAAFEETRYAKSGQYTAKPIDPAGE